MEISTTGWIPLTEDMYVDLDDEYWVAQQRGIVLLGTFIPAHKYSPARFETTEGYVDADSTTHIMRMVVPKHPSESQE